MRPALSVIFFTVFSGAGLGLLVWLVGRDAFSPDPLTRTQGLQMLAVAVGFTTAGLISSTLHLANPKNAWRAFSQFRTSWLSREGVFALCLFPVALLYALCLASPALSSLRSIVGAVLVLLALAVLYCTGMIYACLKTVPRWHTKLVPAAYILLGLASGVLVGLAVETLMGRVVAVGASRIAVSLLLSALAIKLLYFWRFRAPRAELTVNQALRLGKKTIRLLDVGHTHGTFLTDEFCFQLARGFAVGLRAASIFLIFVMPLLLLTLTPGGTGTTLLVAVSCLLGLLAERWLFFAEAEHVVRLYHGASSVG